MPTPATDSSDPSLSTLPPLDDPAPSEGEDAQEATAARNFGVLAAFQIVVRTGWIFKTESIVMPAVLDTVAGAGWVRGCLPLLNRFGHSVPPLLLADRVRRAPRKKWTLMTTTLLMGACFLLLSLLFRGPTAQGYAWVPALFLALYTAFFMCIGINQMVFATIQGKLVETTSRGRLLLVSSTIGAVIAVTCALLMLPGWLHAEAPRFDLIFGFSGCLFAAAGVLTWCLSEAPDGGTQATAGRRHNVLRDALEVWSGDANFRRLAVVGALFGSSIMLFPHYQNVGLQEMQLDLQNLVWWVIVQNIGTGLFSIPAGRLADRNGNRVVLLIGLLAIAAAPLLAVLLSSTAGGARYFVLVFLFVGLTPLMLRTLQNFTLEICPPEDHPRYLSTLGICTSVPMFLSPVVGWLFNLVGYTTVFVGVALLVLVAWILAFGLQEPREHVSFGFMPTDD